MTFTVFSSCKKKELTQPNTAIFTLTDIDGNWYASENKINADYKYSITTEASGYFVDNIDENFTFVNFENENYNFTISDSRTIILVLNTDINKYIILRR